MASRNPLKGRDIVLELEDRKQYQETQAAIEKLGGTVVDTIDDTNLPFGVISSHPSAVRLRKENGVYNKTISTAGLPLLLKEAVKLNVNVWSYDAFKNWLGRTRLQSRNPLQSKVKKPEQNSKSTLKIPRKLRAPFMKFQDANGDTAPVYKEFYTSHLATLFFGNEAGRSAFERASPSVREMREMCKANKKDDVVEGDSMDEVGTSISTMPQRMNRNIRTPLPRYCELCGVMDLDMEEHYESIAHKSKASRPGVYDEVDAYLGSTVDYISVS
ncbi:unnamed protein product [Nippostrongylus brasiliensis]|uniref:DBF4-type domain-containing protein n=1 Tax=Nippostrongylus brasiliensis TaxID=27835 RepID=A0A0N4YCA1_NIPBR|nr:unnamed protein product [Nippostrongylus brasiliensis]